LVERSIECLKKTISDANVQLPDVGDIILVGGTTRIPMIQESLKTLFGKEPKKDINPEEVVATGAAVVAGALQGDIKDILLLDVTPLTLSIETMGGVATAMIDKNTYIPVKKSQIFSTASDNQTAVEVHVIQGERSMAQDNKTLARFILDGIPPSPRGLPQIEVTFDIDANGILNVAAVDKATSRQQSVKVEASTGLNKDEVEKLKQEAEKFSEEDKKKKEVIEVKNVAENLTYSAEKSLKDSQDKIPADLKTKVEMKITELKKAIETNDLNTIKTASESLSATLPEIGSYLYKQKENAAPDQPSEDQKPEAGEDKPQDAEFKEN
ncbi:MAG: Hsp70 family protein, partial [Candidatus Parcubacteria bacterium]|nr:Hsp70 family protein [Candidatus Parcubacteria bacterium]